MKILENFYRVREYLIYYKNFICCKEFFIILQIYEFINVKIIFILSLCVILLPFFHFQKELKRFIAYYKI